MLRVSKNLKNLAKKLDYTNDGCTGVPDVNPEVLKCCNQHDFDWRNPQLGVGLFKSNWKFFKCIIKCRSLNFCQRAALACLYYTGVSSFGVLFYVKEEWIDYRYTSGVDDDEWMQ